MEVWKDIKGYEGFYQVSDTGKVKSLERTVMYKNGKICKLKSKILNLSDNGKGYLWVYLSKENKHISFYVHRLVAVTFLENIENYKEINHLNGIKSDNQKSNLEWCTASQNRQHAYDNNLRVPKGAVGESNTKAKLNEQQVKEIYNLTLEKKLTQKEIAKIYNIDRTIVSSIKLGKIWKHLKLTNNEK